MEEQETNILNLIADIRTLGDDLEERSEELAKLEGQVEDTKEDVEHLRAEIRAKRDQLDGILDELIPDRQEEDRGSGYGNFDLVSPIRSNY